AFLAGWRSLVARAQVWPETAAPARDLAALAVQLLSAGGVERPAFPGGPTAAELRSPASVAAQQLFGKLVDDEPGDEQGATAGAGRLLVAELAAADAMGEVGSD
nr:hypothetical protein [Pseudonocardiales bacterium]